MIANRRWYKPVAEILPSSLYLRSKKGPLYSKIVLKLCNWGKLNTGRVCVLCNWKTGKSILLPNIKLGTFFLNLNFMFDYILMLLLSRFSHVRLCATPETAAHQAPPSLGFSRQEHWSGLPLLALCKKRDTSIKSGKKVFNVITHKLQENYPISVQHFWKATQRCNF